MPITDDQLAALLPADPGQSGPDAPDLRLRLEDWLFEQFGPKLAIVGVGPATIPATPTGQVPAAGSIRLPTAALNGPLASALGDAGLPAADPFAVADADLAAVPADASARFRDLLAIRALELVVDRWPHPDQVAGSESRSDLGKLLALVQAALKARRDEARDRYGFGRPAAGRGSIRLDIFG